MALSAPGSPPPTEGSPEERRWQQFVVWLNEAGGPDPEKRQAARMRLGILPRAQIVEHLGRYWAMERSARVYRKLLMLGWMGFALLLCLTGGVLAFFRLWHLLETVLSILLHGVPMLSFLGIFLNRSGISGQRGAIYVLTQHQYVELVPLLVEALPLASRGSRGTANHRTELIGALVRLLPRFVAADLPQLSEKQRWILRSELRQYSTRLRDPYSSIGLEEAEFVAVLLTTLRAPRLTGELPESPGRRSLPWQECQERQERQEWREMEQAIEELAIERVAPPQETQMRRQVREAAREALVRLSA